MSKTISISTYKKIIKATTIVEENGFLSVVGNKITNEKGQAIQLKGMSLMGHYIEYLCTPEVIKWLVRDWKCQILRLPVHAADYVNRPEYHDAIIKTVADTCIQEGIYFIIDWHTWKDNYESKSKAFFDKYSKQYGKVPNSLFEIWNEPEEATWNGKIKPYHDTIIPIIRNNTQNIVICGTQAGEDPYSPVLTNPLTHSNVSYTHHFYAGSYVRADKRAHPQMFLNSGYSLFISEFGATEYTGDGFYDEAELNLYFKWMDDNLLSYCNWCIENQKETSSVLKFGAATDGLGGWKDSDLALNGIVMRNKLREGFLFKTGDEAGRIEDVSTNIYKWEAFPQGWIIKETDTGITKIANGIDVYERLASLLKGKAFCKRNVNAYKDASRDKPFNGILPSNWNDLKNMYIADFWAADDKYLGLDLGKGKEKTITKLRIYPRPGYEKPLNGLVIQGGNIAESALFTDLGVIEGISGTKWYEFDITDTTKYRFIRIWSSKSPVGWGVGEVEVYGY